MTARPLVSSMTAVLLGLFATPSRAELVQQGPKIVAPSLSRFGASVAMSADGNTAIAGGPIALTTHGYVALFTRVSGAWLSVTLNVTGESGFAGKGSSVAMSADGNTAVVGGNADAGGAGAVWIFTRSGEVWSQQGAKLVGTGAVDPAAQGSSAAISADGSTIAVGGSQDDSGMGAVWIFTRSGGAWTQQGAKLVGLHVDGPGRQGLGVALTTDGNMAAIGAENADGYSGGVYLFTRSGGVWSQQGSRLFGSGGQAALGVGLGRSVAISGDGRSLVAGGPYDNSGVGAVWYFAAAEPLITSAVDIPNDQGGWLRLGVERSGLDFPVSNPATLYAVWRLVPEGTALSCTRVRPNVSAIPAGIGAPQDDGRILASSRDPGDPSTTSDPTFPPGTWELVASVPALRLVRYVVAVPTISNATPNEFVMTVSTASGAWYLGNVISGQSVDNLAPTQPSSLTASYSEGATHLQWAANSEPDLGAYHLHRGTSAGFVPSLANRIASQIGTSFEDVGPAGSYYKLSALDVNGNESLFALVTPGGTVDAGTSLEPVGFALDGARPNPASAGRLCVSFALPDAGRATLELLDVSGRRVAMREVGSLGAGRHTVTLAGGRRLAAGLYWVRLTQTTNQARKHVAVVE